jgi:hypothetical protein
VVRGWSWWSGVLIQWGDVVASAEVIGLLCAGSTMFHPGGGFAGDRLSRGEMAGLLAGIGANAMHLALAKYADDLDAERKLVAHVRVWAAGLAVRESWQIERGRPTVSNMAALAVFEVVRPNRCGRCHGTGYRGMRTCSTCQATGVKALTGRQLAAGMLIDECNYRRRWKKRYDRCFAYVNGLECSVFSALRAADRRDDLIAV